MNFEDTIRDSLNDALAVPGHIDIDPAAGQLIRTAALRHRRNRRVTMASSFGAVIAVVAGIVVWSTGAHGNNGKPVVPATPRPIMSPSVTPAPTTGPSTAPSTSPSVTGTTPPAGGTAPSTRPVTQTNSVAIAGATLTLPAGWVVKEVAASGNSGPTAPSWCLLPRSSPGTTISVDEKCPLYFKSTGSEALSVDTQGGLASNPEYCGVGDYTTNQLLDYQDHQFGGRLADYRQWLLVCKDGTRWPVEQYVADNSPGYILFSDQADANIHAAMASIAAATILPSISAPLRLSDYGIIRNVSNDSVGYHISLDRVISSPDGPINNNPATYDYVIPANVVSAGQEPKVGDQVEIGTNGITVTSFVNIQ